ncbi:MAG: NAD-dependent epimerase/dehydratase family protein [Candidatus Heimdallarchaeota archaeon]
MRIFIAGGTGVLGKRLLPLLIKQNHQVGVLARSEEQKRWIEKQGAIGIQTDLFDRERMIPAIQGYEAVLHLATAIPRKSRTSPKDWQLNRRIREEGTDVLISATLRNKCELFIIQSVTFNYGHREGAWVDESIKPSVPVPSSVKLSKEFQELNDSNVIMENRVLNAVENKNLPGIILRFGWFYSYDSLNISQFAKNQFSYVGDGSAYWNIISVDDAVEAIVKAIENYRECIGMTFNVCDNEPVKVKDLLTYSAKVAGFKNPKKIPELLVKNYAGTYALSFLKNSVRVKNINAKEKLQWTLRYPTYKEGIKEEIRKFLEYSR